VNNEILKIREQFPILNRMVYGKPFAYLDNAATTQKPTKVVKRVSDYYEWENSNVHRGAHFLSQEATVAFEKARTSVSQFINSSNSSEIIFTKGTTESINLVANSYGNKFLKKDDEILITRMEHHSNIVPWQMLCSRTGAKLKVSPIDFSGEMIMREFEKLLNTKTKIVAITHVSNSLGTINPIKEVIEKAHDAGAVVLIDGAQAVSNLKVDVQELDCDFYCFSGHKMYAPMGIGALYGKENLLDKMDPWQGGGEMIAQVTFDKTTYNEIPFKFEAGTPNVSGALGFEAAIHFLSNIGYDFIVNHKDDLLNYGHNRLAEIAGLKFHGTAKRKTGLISFNIEGVHPYDAAVLLDKLGVAIRTGHLCAQPTVDFYNVPGFIRASFGVYNTREEIDLLCDTIEKVKEILS